MKFSNAISDFRTPIKSNYWLILCLISFAVLWISTLIGTTDFMNWILENALVFIFGLVLVVTYKYTNSPTSAIC
jgi:putative membrane protein